MDEFQAMMKDMEAKDVFGGRSSPADAVDRRRAKTQPAESVEELQQQMAEDFETFSKQREERGGDTMSCYQRGSFFA